MYSQVTRGGVPTHWDTHVIKDYAVGYSNCHVFWENLRGSLKYKCTKRFWDTLKKWVFQYFEPLLANLALKFQKSANMTLKQLIC